ncbi:uncharacterized protein MEPE_06272 [Melanopsichium pennsylvanicum]|uniref:Uncharacterized protein n=1 Tax=Melanopsichium pennsylvanicum TaxID=63383 RepID=A0AAJ4XSF3_9BASI|nr:uncharacterized protein MEPE_06272 [Melanopsichium pennsylvanicum]
MVDQPKWRSSRVAHLRQTQRPSQEDVGTSGTTQQSRWSPQACSSFSTSSNTAAAAAAAAATATAASSPMISSSSSTVRQFRTSDQVASSGSASSRWATIPNPTNPSVSSLADQLSSTSINPSTRAIAVPKVHEPIHPISSCSSSTLSTASNPTFTARRKDGLTIRDASKPLGGKSLDRFALLASPSRGLDSTTCLSSQFSAQESMDLTSPTVQAEFRDYISTRLVQKALPLLSSPDIPSNAVETISTLNSSRYLVEDKHEKGSDGGIGNKLGEGEEELQQILLLVRKLREALVASKRIDAFCVEVYELSAYLSILCCDVPQLAATLPRLVLEIYPNLSTSSEQVNTIMMGKGDVEQLATKLNVRTVEKLQGFGRDDKRRGRMISLYLLHLLCLSARATRLGQSCLQSSNVVELLHRGLKEYIKFRTILEQVYGTELNAHFKLCDAVYKALRDVDAFSYSDILQGKANVEYEVDGWQALVLVQTLPLLRKASWAIARKAYMYLPVSSGVVERIKPGKEGVERGNANGIKERYLVQLLLLCTDILPASSSDSKGNKKEAKVKKRSEKFDEWDTESNHKVDSDKEHQVTNHIEDNRLYSFLSTQFDLLSLPDRLMPIKGGYAIKIR